MRVLRQKINETKEQDIRYVFRYIKSENQKNANARHLSDNQIYEKVGSILHVSAKSVRNVLTKTNQKDRNESSKKRHYKYKIDEFDRDLIRNVIYQFYAQRTLPTAIMIMDNIKNDIDISMFVLYDTLKDLGFCWRRTGNDRRVAIERSETVAARSKYLRDIGVHGNQSFIWTKRG